MTRWRRAPIRRPGRGRQSAPTSPGAGDHGAARATGRAGVLVDEFDGLILLRSAPDVAPGRDGVAELARAVAGADEYFTLVIGADDASAELWARLGTVLDSLRAKGVTTVRIVLSGAGGQRVGRPALAQRIADAWGIEVIAPDAGVLILPGGSLFALGADVPGHGWRSFTPGAEPTLLGPRSPVPAWQSALARLSDRTAGGYIVEQVPAGILIRSAREPRDWAVDLCYSVPVDGEHLTVLVGAPRLSGDAELSAEELASLLSALPAATRAAVRLAPCGPVDLLPVAQDTAEILGAEVEVWTGLPLVVGSETEPVVRPVLIGADAEPTWAPFVETVACRPYGADGTDGPAAPRLVRWRSPLSGGVQTDKGVIRISDRWQVAVTMSGLIVGPHGEPPTLAGRPVAPEQLAIEVNLRGAPADDALFAGLSRVLSDLDADVREFVALHRVAQPEGSDDDGFRLLRLAIEHNVSLVEPKPVEAAPAPASPTVRTVATPHTARAQAEPSASPPSARAEASAFAVEHSAPARANAAGPAADGFPSPTRPPLPDRVAFPQSAQASSPAPVPEESAAPGRANPPGDPTEGSAPPPNGDPSHTPEPPIPPSSAVTDPTRTDSPAPTGPRQGSDAKSLPPNLAKIPLTPVTPREPAEPSAPAAPVRPAEPQTPVRPTESQTPVRPVESQAPVRPAESQVPVRPAKSQAPVTPPNPRPPAEPIAAERPSTTTAAGPAASDPVTPSRTAEPSPADRAVPSAPPAEPQPGPASVAGGARPGPVAKPLRRSTEAERAEFRSLVQPIWERHSAAVNRALTRMPALRGGQVDAARIDLVAVHVHLSGGLGEPYGREPGSPGGPGFPDSYLACLTSGLSRLPSYRGAAVRGGLSADAGLERFVPGTVLRGPVPVSALPIGGAAGLSAAVGGYVIWSSTGRRVRPLLGSGSGAGSGAGSDEVVFSPGTTFRVLGVRSDGQAPIVLLSEVLGGGSKTDDRPGVLGAADQAVLEKLGEALRRHPPAAEGASPVGWPVRCAEPLGGAM
ncbi:hypothetical protein NE236_26200 [Actinoallomurus purpureus]|uniref:hypothetical protein n=1 Tax=Actinoallomurus purpureus TaxID=478114 RepID=UPI0020926BA4|nr:hypothetical protein [Actinoallomurus purpureus]MCO6008473.1 hypothetical protein [Actinoallomurus purpureus]